MKIKAGPEGNAAFFLFQTDPLPYVDFDVAKAKKDTLTLNRKLKIFEVSCKTGAGLKDWFNWRSERIQFFQSK